MSTRLLVLGAVRFMQPVHGYDVRRELVSWQLEDVANVKPGSIYSALKTLHRDGLITADDAEKGIGPERTAYRLTGEGEKEFQILLRNAWWDVDLPAEPLIPALTMFPSLPRNELIAAVESRIEQLRGRERQLAFMENTIQVGATGQDGSVPDHAREVLLFLQARFRAEADWARGFRKRLSDGAYTMSGEPGAWTDTVRTVPDSQK